MNESLPLQFYSYTGIKLLQMGASTRDCFPIQFSNPFLPLSGSFLYNPNAETTESKIVTIRHSALTVQRVGYRHILQICTTNIVALVVAFGLKNSLKYSAATMNDNDDAFPYA